MQNIFITFSPLKGGEKHVAHLNKEGLRILTKQEWPGNIRQLSHTMERAILISMARSGAVLRFDADILQNSVSTQYPASSAQHQNFKAEMPRLVT